MLRRKMLFEVKEKEKGLREVFKGLKAGNNADCFRRGNYEEKWISYEKRKKKRRWIINERDETI